MEPVSALEHNFEAKERAASFARATVKNVPLLLKPNGVPVFQKQDGFNAAGSMNQTIKQSMLEGGLGAHQQTSAIDLDRTVKAHNFVVGKPTQNQTPIATVLDMQKTSTAEDQAFPVKVLYVKPSMVKHVTRPKTAATGHNSSGVNATNQKRALLQQRKTAWNQQKDDLEVSMGELSGIFKEDRVPVKQSKPRKGLSADQIAREQRIQAQKLYSKMVQNQALQKAKEQEMLKKEKEKTERRRDGPYKGDNTAAQSQLTPVDELAATVKRNTGGPHSENRFKGQMSSMTAELFRRAQEKLQIEKQEEKIKKQLEKEKRDKEKQYLDEIKKRNIEIIKQQRETGTSLPPGALKQRENKLKEMKHQLQIKEDNEKRKELRQKRFSESRAMLGLDQADHNKLVQLSIQKEQEFAIREQERRAKERIAREQARKAEAQKQAAKRKLNKDLIDFTDPNAGTQLSTRGRTLGQTDEAKLEQEDEEAQEIQKQRRAAILAEQREKRRIKEQIKAQEEAEERARREDEMRNLQETLTQQRIQIAKKQQAVAERQQRKERMMRRDAAKSTQSLSTNKKSKTRKNQDDDIELDVLKDWIDEQIKRDQQRMDSFNQKESGTSHSLKTSSPHKQKTIEDTIQNELQQVPGDGSKSSGIPGNNKLPPEQEKLAGIRQNRYGILGDNGFGDMVAYQADKEGVKLPQSQSNILDFQQSPERAISSSNQADQYDMQPVKQGKKQSRTIVNRAQPEDISPAVVALPGVTNVKQEAAKQKAEEDKRRLDATITIQRHARGWQDRNKVQKYRAKIRREADEDRSQFVEHYKMHDKYNINRYLKEKERLRKLNKTDKIEESISENLAISNSQVDAVIGSFDQSKPTPNLQTLLGRAAQRATERDPNSLIAIYAKNKAPVETTIEKERSVSGHRMDKRMQRQQKESKRLHASGGKKRSGGSSVKRKYRSSEIEEEIEENIPKSNKDDDDYSSDFQSEHISESLPSYLGSSKSKPKDAKTSSEIQESIYGSGNIQISQQKKDFKTSNFHNKGLASGTSESIPEHVQSQSIIEEEIIDEVEGIAEKEDEISEESYLRESKQEDSSAVRVPKVVAQAKQQTPTGPLPKKSERVREGIEYDYDNDGAVPLAGSLKAQKMREMQDKLAKDQEHKYRMSKQIIEEFESKKAIGSEEHQKLIKGLAEELQRYEAAVSGSIFIEQFQSIVQKSLAQRDMMMLGQRLTQMEAEKKHQQEIADIRAEQLKMMSQLLILQAGAGSGSGSEANAQKQAELLKGIQKLVDKPVIIQRTENDIIEESHVSKKSHAEIQRTPNQHQQSMKYTSITQSQLKDSRLLDQRSGVDDSGQIADEIGSVQPGEDEEDSIIEESMNIEQSQSQQLSAARRYLGSEKAVQDTSKAVIENKPNKQGPSLFNNNSFQNYTSRKFKDLLFNDGSQMDIFLDQIESAINKKCEQQKKELKKQLDSNQISQKTFQQKQRDIEKWVTAERREIKEKRAKVQDTYGEIGQFLKKLEQDKNLIMDKLSNQSTPRKVNQINRSSSQLSFTNSLKDMQDQLKEIQEGHIGGVQPETKYLNKKREYVRQLIQEKKSAIDRGVKERVRNLESDMIDEAMQMALQLDVDQEIEKRVGLLKEKINEAKLEQSKKSMLIDESGKYSNIDQSRMSSVQNNKAEKASQRSGGKKYVRFDSPTQKDPSSSYHSGSKRQAKKSAHSESIAEDLDGDDIGESININESVQQSSASASKLIKSQANEHSQKLASESNKISEKIPENFNEDKEDSINSRVPSDMEGSYSSDFVSGSYAPDKSKGSKQGKPKEPDNEDSEQYSVKFDEASASVSRKTGKDLLRQSQELEALEQSSGRQSQSIQSEQQQKSQKRDSIKSKKQKQKMAEKQRMPSISDLTDREILDSTISVDWQVNLQQKIETSQEESEMDQAPPGQKENSEEQTEDNIESLIQEDESDITQEAGKGLEDLDSYPSASLSKSNEQEFQMRVDNITEDLLNQILQDFQNDQNVRLEVEDNYEEDMFENKWPFSEAKKLQQQQEEKQFSPSPSSPSQQNQNIDGQKQEDKQKESEAQKQHDEAMKKYHEEQSALDEHNKKVVEYLDFMIQIVDKEVLMQALSKPIQHDPLRVLEKIQAFDGEDELDQYSKQNISSQSQVFEPYLFDEIDRQWEELHQNKSDANSSASDRQKNFESDKGWTSKELRNVHHMAIFDSFNEALDLERPYKTKGLPNPWSKQTRLTTASALTPDQVDQIIARARSRVIEWNKTGAGTKFAPPPPPPPAQGDYDSPPHLQAPQESEEERIGAERRERLGLLLTKEVHQKENDWLDYEYEDTQVRFDLADMILEELADEVTQFLVENAEAKGQFLDYNW